MVRRDVSSTATTQQSRAASQLQRGGEDDPHMASYPPPQYHCDSPRRQVPGRPQLPQFSRIALECPGCHREISGPRIEERGVTCPHCNLGIPPDLISQYPSTEPPVTDLLDMALADAEANIGTLQVLPSSGFLD